jgi:hypothetical protein
MENKRFEGRARNLPIEDPISEGFLELSETERTRTGINWTLPCSRATINQSRERERRERERKREKDYLVQIRLPLIASPWCEQNDEQLYSLQLYSSR